MLTNNLSFAFDEEGQIFDLDAVAEKVEELNTQIESYRDSLKRGIKARLQLLEKSQIRNLEELNIPQLLECKEAIDKEFRQRFHLNPLPDSPVAMREFQTKGFQCG
jgi:hypothetical protein